MILESFGFCLCWLDNKGSKRTFRKTLTENTNPEQPREGNNFIVYSNFHTMQKRCPEYYIVIKTHTERFRKSAISTIHDKYAE